MMQISMISLRLPIRLASMETLWNVTVLIFQNILQKILS